VCKEKSVCVKVYESEGEVKRVEFCLNKGCGYVLQLPPLGKIEERVSK